MRFNPKARLDTDRISDSGGGGGGMGGPMRIPLPGGAKAGGGAGMLVILLLLFVLSQCTGIDLTGGGTPQGSGYDTSRVAEADTGRYAECKTGADANESADCARVAVENSLYDYWSTALPDQTGNQVAFQAEGMQTFSSVTNTGCGQASSQVGPFYCPADATIYLDTTFFADVLQRQLGGPAGAFVEPYVLAHEYGHHIQNLMGTMGQVRTQKGPQSDAVRLELQADCYAGMWTKNATTTEDANGDVLLQDLSEEDIRQAMQAAQAVGDDRIQQQTQGRVSPEQWTHGSADQRMNWFMAGYQEGSLRTCDTFSARQL